MPTPSLGAIFQPACPPAPRAVYARRVEAAGFAQLWLWHDPVSPVAEVGVAAEVAPRALEISESRFESAVYRQARA